MEIENLEKIFEGLETKRKEHFRFLKEEAGMDAKAYNALPKPNEWSAHQVHRHLMKSEELSLLYLKKKVKGLENVKPISFTSKLRAKKLWLLLKAPVKVQAPKQVDVPAYYGEIGLVEKEWDELRMETLRYLKNLPAEAWKKELYKHPIVGRIGILDMIRFFGWHADRHYGQILNIHQDELMN